MRRPPHPLALSVTAVLFTLLAAASGPPAAALVIVGGLDLDPGENGWSIEVVGPRAYLGTDSQLVVIDVSNPLEPVRLGAVAIPDTALDVEVVGTLAYVAADNLGLRIIDVSDPAEPVEVSAYDPVGLTKSVEVEGGRAYVTDGSLRIIDVSNPSAPAELGVFESPGFATDVEVRGTVAYLADSFEGFRVIDVSDPAAPTELGALPDLDSTQVEVVGTRVYLAPSGTVIDVSNPASPVVVGFFEGSGVRGFLGAGALRVRDGYAFQAGTQGLRVATLGDDDGHGGGLGEIHTVGWASDVDVEGRTAYLADGRGLRVIDLSHLDTPRYRVELFPYLPRAFDPVPGLAALPGFALVAAPLGSFLVVDVSEPEQPETVAGLDLVFPLDVAASGDLAAVLTFGSLDAFDVSDPANPRPLGMLEPLFGRDIELVGSLAYVVGGSLGFSGGPPPGPGFLSVIDLSDPAHPSELGRLGLPPRVFDVELAGSLAYVANSELGLRVIDVFDPSAMSELAAIDTPGEALGIEVAGGIAAVADGSAGLRLIDVSDLSAPAEIGSLELGYSRDVERSGDLLWVAGGPSPVAGILPAGFVSAVDVSDPTAPFLLGGLATGPVAHDVERMSGITLVTELNGLATLDFGPEYPDARIGIDLAPGAKRNRIDPRKRGNVRVALFGSDAVDAREIDPETLAFGPDAAPAQRKLKFKDLNRDGRLDLVARFGKCASGLARGATRACLRARLFEGARLEGCDSVSTPTPRRR